MKNIRKTLVAFIAVMIFALAAVSASATVSFAGTSNAKNHKPVYVSTSAAYKQLNAYRTVYNKKVKKSKRIVMLKRDANLEKIAKIRAKEIATSGKFSHTRPNGKSGLSLIKGKKAKGENIAKGQKSCAEVSAAWYASKGHRANMLRGNFRKVGIAAYKYKGVIYWAQVYSS